MGSLPVTQEEPKQEEPPPKEELKALDPPPEPIDAGRSGSNEFRIKISKTDLGSKIGVDTVAFSSEKGRALRIKKVKAGLVSDWNESNPQAEVKEGDIIMEV